MMRQMTQLVHTSRMRLLTEANHLQRFWFSRVMDLLWRLNICIWLGRSHRAGRMLQTCDSHDITFQMRHRQIPVWATNTYI